MSASSDQSDLQVTNHEMNLKSKSNDVTDNKLLAEDTDQTPQQVAHHFPEGGLKAWMVVLGCWCTSFASFGYVNSFGSVLQEPREP